MTAAHNRPHGVHLVGSVSLSSAEEVFRTASTILGARLRRLPDGETGERSGWIAWQRRFLLACPQLEAAPPNPASYAPVPRVRLRQGVSVDEIVLTGLGYADAAKSSYAVFAELKAASIVPAACRFQVSLPTPLAPIAAVVEADSVLE